MEMLIHPQFIKRHGRIKFEIKAVEKSFYISKDHLLIYFKIQAGKIFCILIEIDEEIIILDVGFIN